MLNKLIQFLLIILIITLPLVNSHLLDFFWLKKISDIFYINWNYEFSKVLFFNIFSWIIILLFLFKKLLNIFNNNIKLIFPKILFYIIWIIIISNVFSLTTYTSLLWNSSKWHSSLMFINLIWLFLVFINLFKNKINNRKINLILLKTFIFSWIFVSFFWIKEFLFPIFDYKDLSNRAISTFGHPNYLSLYLIIIIPIINIFLTNYKQWIKKILYYSIYLFVIIWLFLTKSVWALFIFFHYIFYIKLKNNYKIIKLNLFNIIFLYSILILTLTLIILKVYPEKLSSFISRFYIWETTLDIIFSNIKIIIIWNWLWTLDLIFEWYKSIELYIFEKFWFIADRPHNIFLNIFYNFWFFWIIIFLYLIKLLYNYYKIIKNNIFKNQIKDNTSLEEKNYILIIIIFLIFIFLNFASIASYLIIIFIISLIYLSHKKYLDLNNQYIKSKKLIFNTKKIFYKVKIYHYILNYFIILFFISTSLFSIYFYSIYFLEEHKLYNNPLYKTKVSLLKKINSENIEKEIYKKNLTNPEILCEELIINSSSSENYIYCWNILYYSNKNLAIFYYNLWLKKLPDLWNSNSKYYNNIFINKKNLQHRFFNIKYWNIIQVLKRVWIKMNY